MWLVNNATKHFSVGRPRQPYIAVKVTFNLIYVNWFCCCCWGVGGRSLRRRGINHWGVVLLQALAMRLTLSYISGNASLQSSCILILLYRLWSNMLWNSSLVRKESAYNIWNLHTHTIMYIHMYIHSINLLDTLKDGTLQLSISYLV